jgi:phosphoribosylamine---glycine ligase
VMASAGYPAGASKGDVIRGIDEAQLDPKVEITHAGTAARNGEIVTAGGRVLNVTGRGASPDEARARAYEAVERIHFDGEQYRRDIADRAVTRVVT